MLEPQNSERVLVTPTGLRIPGMLSFDDWETTGRKLVRIHDSSCWCLGDWVVYGERSYQDRYRIAIDAVGLDYQTLRNYAWVARNVDPGRRRAELSFQHHAEVASLDVVDQQRWLETAVQGGWSRNRLRRALRAERDAARGVPTTEREVLPRVSAPQERMRRWSVAAERSGSTFEGWIAASLDRAAEQDLVLTGT